MLLKLLQAEAREQRRLWESMQEGPILVLVEDEGGYHDELWPALEDERPPFPVEVRSKNVIPDETRFLVCRAECLCDDGQVRQAEYAVSYEPETELDPPELTRKLTWRPPAEGLLTKDGLVKRAA